MYELLVTEPEYLDSEGKAALEGIGHLTAKHMQRGELERAIRDADVILVRSSTTIDSGLMEKAKKLKVIASATTSLEHIDTAYAASHGIEVISLHGAHTLPTAQHTLALILSLCRRIPWAFDSMRQGLWERHKFIGVQLDGKTLGIIGLGRIGSAVASYAKALGMRVVAYDPYAKAGEIDLVKSLPELLEASDVITIHTMLTEETRNLIGAKEFMLMKKGSFIVNAARAEIVDCTALLEALESGRIAGAAIDTFVDEPVEDADNALVKYARGHDNLLLTPHLGASTHEAAHSAVLELAEGIRK